MAFPESVGQFHRVEITQYDARQKNVGVGYSSTNARSPAIMTVYVLSAPSFDMTGASAAVRANTEGMLFQAMLKDAMEAILQRHPEASGVTNEVFVLHQGTEQHPGCRLTCVLSFPFGGEKEDAISQLLLFQYRRWVIKYRVTYPLATKMGSGLEVGDFLQALPWPK